jgi:hypothetical protein
VHPHVAELEAADHLEQRVLVCDGQKVRPVDESLRQRHEVIEQRHAIPVRRKSQTARMEKEMMSRLSRRPAEGASLANRAHVG